MSFNALGQYTGSHKVWDHFGNIIPEVEHSEGDRPSVEWHPASWLPTVFFDKHYENYFVLMPGKIVASDNNGDICPAQYGLAAASITYLQRDVDAGVTDVRTGVALLVANIGTFTVASVSNFMGLGSAMAVSSPIGIAPYAYIQWAGGDGFNPADYTHHNYNMQHQVAVVCDYVLEIPLVPATTAAAENMTFGSPVSNISTGTALASKPVASNTARTPITFAGGSAATLFTNQVSVLTGVKTAGDWFINLTTGVVTVYATSQPTSITATYSHYASAPSTVSSFSSAVGNLKTGDFVRCDYNSNFTLAASGDNFQQVMGQVLGKISYPRDALDRVRTAYNPALGTSATYSKPGSAGQMDQMPGSATGGVTDKVHYAGAADTTVLINLISR
jgi:hypothetical protein